MEGITLIDCMILVVLFLQSAILLFYLYYLLDPKYSFEFSMAMFCLIDWSITLLSYLNYSNLPLRQILHFGIFFLLTYVLFRNSAVRKILAVLSGMIIACVCDLTAVVVMSCFFPEIRQGFPNDYVLLIGNLLFSVLFLAAVNLVVLVWGRVKKRIMHKSIYAAALFPISQFLLLDAVVYTTFPWVLNKETNGIPMLLLEGGCVLCVAADIILFKLVLSSSERDFLAAQLEVLNLQGQRELEYYDSVNEKIQEIRKIRHDFNNQLQAAYGAVLTGTEQGRETAAALLQELERDIRAAAPVYACPNLIVNVILEEKDRLARTHGVSMDVSVQIPEKLGVDKADLCSVFSNLLDNAIREAAASSSDRIVRVRSWIRSGYLMVKVSSPLGEDVQRTARRQSPYHGYGLTILNSIAEKYSGEMSVEKNTVQYTAEIKLKLRQGEEESENEDSDCG